MKTLRLLAAFLFISMLGFSQNKKSFDVLICKEWKLSFYEEAGKKVPPMPEQKDDKMIFYKDHKVTSVEGGVTENGVWEYEATQKLLTVTDTKTKDVLKVIKINENECVLEYKDPEGVLMTIHMAPAVRKL